MHASPKDPLLERIWPEKKVAASALTGAAVVVLLWVARLLGVEMPDLVAESLVVLVAGVAGWLAPHTRRDDAA